MRRAGGKKLWMVAIPAAIRNLPASPRTAAYADFDADIAPVPDQQGTSDLLLQAFNLFAECGLRDMQQTRRTAEV